MWMQRGRRLTEINGEGLSSLSLTPKGIRRQTIKKERKGQGHTHQPSFEYNRVNVKLLH